MTTTESVQAIVYKYEKPENPEKRAGKIHIPLARTDIGSLKVQVLAEGGENNLHSHSNRDGFWFVLQGRVRFYTTGDELIAELGQYEGIATPRGFPYWFEAVPGDEELVLLQYGANTRATTASEDTADRNDLQPPRH